MDAAVPDVGHVGTAAHQPLNSLLLQRVAIIVNQHVPIRLYAQGAADARRAAHYNQYGANNGYQNRYPQTFGNRSNGFQRDLLGSVVAHRATSAAIRCRMTFVNVSTSPVSYPPARKPSRICLSVNIDNICPSQVASARGMCLVMSSILVRSR